MERVHSDMAEMERISLLKCRQEHLFSTVAKFCGTPPLALLNSVPPAGGRAGLAMSIIKHRPDERLILHRMDKRDRSNILCCSSSSSQIAASLGYQTPENQL